MKFGKISSINKIKEGMNRTNKHPKRIYSIISPLINLLISIYSKKIFFTH